MLDPNKAVEQMQSEFSAGFQAGAASRDAEIAELKDALGYDWDKYKASQMALRECMQMVVEQADRDEWKARAEFSYRQRDELNRLCEFNEKTMSALQADNARLREALVKHVAPYLGHKEVYDEVLASIPAQSLSRLRNRVLDEAINVAWNNEPDCNGPIEMALRKLKEPE